MKLVALLVVLVVTTWLGARALTSEQHAGPTASQGQSIVDQARQSVDTTP